jgi:hypothetical protein
MANYGGMDSVRYKCSYLLTDIQGKVPVDLTVFSHVERIQDGNRFYVRNCDSEKGFDDSESVIVNTYNGYLGRRYEGHSRSGEIYRGRRGRPLETDDPLGIYMGTAIWRWDGFHTKPRSTWLRWALKLTEEYPAGAPLFTFEYTQGIINGYIWVRPYLESVGGQICHVMAVVFSKREGYLYWFAHEKGMLLMRKEYYRRGEILDESIEVEQIASTTTTSGSEVWYPRVATRQIRHGDDTLTYKLHVYEYSPRIVVPSDTFDLSFPDGTQVSDEITGIQYKKEGPYKKEVLSLFKD